MASIRVGELEQSGRRVVVLGGPGRDIPDQLREPPSRYSVIDMDEAVGVTAGGEPIRVARDGYGHTRVVVR